MSSLLYGVAEEINNIADRSFIDDSGYVIHPHQLQPYYKRRTSKQLLEPTGKVNDATPKEETISSFDEDGFQITMNVPHYKSNELSVRVIDSCIVVEGKHRERADQHGYISRQFARRYALPAEYDIEQVASTLSTDGVLKIRVPALPKGPSREKTIPIKETGRRRSSAKTSFSEAIDLDVMKK